MPKQTVEQAAQMHYVQYGAYMCRDAKKESFLIGAQWQREQGIEWVPTSDGNLPAVGEYVLILLEGETFLIGKIMFDSQGSLIWVAFFADGEHPCQLRSVTHWAHINLPKTDK